VVEEEIQGQPVQAVIRGNEILVTNPAVFPEGLPLGLDVDELSRKRTVVVIIPFYQKDPGILRRAMVSILMQELPQDLRVRVFIVDDSSPLSPAQDLTDLPLRDDVTWSVHHQSNGGPGAARNLGLEMANKIGADFVAFLDSDDEWLPPHLAQAVWALDQGYGFYFCDNERSDAHDSYADTVPSLADKGAKLRDKAAELDLVGPVFGFDEGSISAEMIEACLSHTSCVVLRGDVASAQRFDQELRVAGEDHMYWINLALDQCRIAISWRPNVRCGRGVSIFYSSFDWNDPSTLNRLGHLLLMFEKLRLIPKAVAAGGHHIKTLRRNRRLGYSFLFTRNLARGRLPHTEVLFKIARYDPMIFFRIPFFFMRAALDRRPESRKW
jgi:succinoglycan biosynthesis protein ExoW